MGRIVAAPTAGSCGVLPGVLFSLAEPTMLQRKTGGGPFNLRCCRFGYCKECIPFRAEGGCQAEIGSASAMVQLP